MEVQGVVGKENKENTRNEDLAHIKEWLLKQPHLPNSFDDARLTHFLRGCKFSLETCKKKLDMYFTMRAAVPEFFKNRNIKRSELRELLKVSQGPPLPNLTPDGRRVLLLRYLGQKTEIPNVVDLIKLCLMIADIRLEIEDFDVTGDIYIIDANSLTTPFFTKISPVFLKKFLACIQEAYPMKIKEIHVVNVNNLVDAVITLAKPFVKEKIRNRIFVHQKLATLYDYIPKYVIPEEYGGTSGKMSDFHEQWLKKLEEYTPWFEAQEEVQADESKRPANILNYNNLFGIEGSFRKLTID